MCNPERIRPLLDRLEEMWINRPDLRLGQLILNKFSLHNGVDATVYYLEDEEFITQLEEMYNEPYE